VLGRWRDHPVLLSEAAGNPLALMELPITAARLEPIAPGSLPLTQRLEQAFAARVADLPAATRLLLLVAAHSDDESLSEIREAASAVAGSALGLDLLEPAAEAGIVDLDLHSVRFRHPLIRSAVRQSASLLQRRRVHEALAEVLRAEPDRRVEALGADLTHWPLQRARLLLAHGRWLRRRRRIAESRTPLRDARDAFDAMGCAAWGDQARRELRASGESSRRRDLAARDQLTAQELQIAQLAAQGLSNRDIAQRLYLSHRTIGTHLYRIFPKLGITSRGELPSALSAQTASGER
jgi:DNA-binding CsgD family transcriptional regulator